MANDQKLTKIRYSRERLRINLRMGIFFIGVGIILVILSFSSSEWNDISIYTVGVGQIGAGILMMILYAYENRKQYLTLINGELKKIQFSQKKYNLTK